MRRRIPVLAALATVASLLGAPAARAAFPGGNGRIVFQHEAPAGDHAQTDLYSVRPDGSGLRRLTNTPGFNEFGPAWNPAGTLIAFWRTPAPFGPGSLWVMAADGTQQRQLTMDVDARDPVWNPQGTRLAYTGPGTGGGTDIWTLRASDGGDRRRVTSGPPSDFEAAWSPDGHAIAFTRGLQQGDPGDLEVVDLATKAVTPVTQAPAYDHQVAWAPGGQELVFERDFSSASSIFTVHPDGTGLDRLTRGSFFDTGPAFSPEGDLVAFGTDRSGQTFSDLWLMDPDGSKAHPLVSSVFSEGFPDWQPLAG